MTDESPAAEEPTAMEMEMEVPAQSAAPARTAADGYAFAAVVCAAAGLLLPIGLTVVGGWRGAPSFAVAVVTAPAALMLARATEEPVTGEAPSPSVERAAGVAQMLAYASLALVVTFYAVLLLGIAGKLVTG